MKKELNITQAIEKYYWEELLGHSVWMEFFGTIDVTESDLFLISDSELSILNALTKDEIVSILRKIMTKK